MACFLHKAGGGQGRLQTGTLLAARLFWRYKIAMSITGSEKPKKGRPSKDSEAVNVRFERGQIEAIDDWRRTEAGMPTRPAAVRRLTDIGLQVAGKAPDPITLPDTDEGPMKLS